MAPTAQVYHLASHAEDAIFALEAKYEISTAEFVDALSKGEAKHLGVERDDAIRWFHLVCVLAEQGRHDRATKELPTAQEVGKCRASSRKRTKD